MLPPTVALLYKNKELAIGAKGNKRQWSTCCVEDFTKMVNNFPNCLKEIDPLNPPKEITEQELSPRECNMQKLKPGANGYDEWNLNGDFFINIIAQLLV